METRNGEATLIPVADILRTVAATMQQERARLNGLSSFAGDGRHGDRMAQACRDAADAVQGTGTGDAGEDLQLAGQVLADPNNRYGHTAGYLGRGLIAAGEQLVGQPGLSLVDLAPLLTNLLAGAQAGDAAQPGEGTMIDVLVPAVAAYNYAAQQGLTYLQATQGLLGGAMSGVRATINMPQPYNRHPRGAPTKSTGYADPGAASTQTFLTGLVRGFLGDRVPATPTGQNSNNFLLNLLQSGIDLGGAVVTPPPPRDVEALFGNTGRAGRYAQPLTDADPGYGMGTDVRPRGE